MDCNMVICRIVYMQLMPEANLILQIFVSSPSNEENKEQVLTLASASRPASLSPPPCVLSLPSSI